MSLPRLSEATLASMRGAARPAYTRADVSTGIVHLGIGAFHRAHQAVYIDDILARGDAGWGILGASLRSPAVQEQLAPQDGLFTVQVRDGAQQSARLIGSVKGVLVAPENPAALIRAMAQPDVRLVTLTITEKGYKLDPGTGNLLEDDAGLAHDYQHPEEPVTALGFLFSALAERRRRGLKPFTILSCDNLPENGARTRSALLSFADRVDPLIADWIAGDGVFPSSMVDRIVPATLPEDIDALAALTGVSDLAMVKTEPFSQWVIEDDFSFGRPEFESVGVQMTADVRGWEEAKLRLLNGAHSSLAYLGGLMGFDFMHQCVADPDLSAFLDCLWDEAAPTLRPVPGLDIAAYRRDLRQRFANAALGHRTRQIAMDGSQKLPQRLLSSLRTRLKTGQPSPALSLGVAAWMRWQLGTDEAGRTHTVDDPLSDRLKALTQEAGRDPARLVQSLTRLHDIFDTDLPADPRFIAGVESALAAIITKGVRNAARAVAVSAA